MNIEVFERLVNNIKSDRISHHQSQWMKDHTNTFVFTEETRWSCATSACAAGFVWLEEAEPGTVFDLDSELVMTPAGYEKYQMLHDRIEEAYDNGDYDEASVAEKERSSAGVKIADWAAEKLGIDDYDANFLFYNFDSTEETLRRIYHLMDGGHFDDYE